MKMKSWCMSAAALLLVAVSAQAQDSKPAYEFKVSGDTVDSFKAEFVLNAKLDQGTPEGTVAAYALLTDNRTENSGPTTEFYKKGAEIVNKAVKPLFEKLLSEELMKLRNEAEGKTEEETTYKAHATEIKGITDGKDGAKLVETYQKTTYMAEAWDPETGEKTGKMEEQSWESKFRYTCIKGEGDKWRIDRVESLMTNWSEMDEEGNAPEEWTETTSTIHWYLMDQEVTKAEELKQDTPENAALSLFNCAFQNRDNWNSELFRRGQKGWLEAIKPLFTEKGLKGPEDSGEKFSFTKEARAVDKVSDGTDGVKKVKFKQMNDWAGAVEVHCKKVGEVWKVVNAGYYELEWNDMGDMVEGEFVETKELDTLTWR